MTDLLIARIKPNPVGKDRTRHGGATAAQLGAEWIDIKNRSAGRVGLAGIELYHLVFRPGQKPEFEKVVDLTGDLDRGQTLRIHSGQVRPLHVLHQEDLAGAELHGFTGRDAYVWNNAEGDGPGLWRPSTKGWVDRTSYDPNPPEGMVLVRTGDKLLVAAKTVSRW